jgi:hypothetical protein
MPTRRFESALRARLWVSPEGSALVVKGFGAGACREGAQNAQRCHTSAKRPFGRLRGTGFALLATFEHPHFTIVLPVPADLTLARFVRCFDAPVANPARSGDG